MSASPPSIDADRVSTARRSRVVPRVLFALYVVGLAIVAIWPAPIDADARPFLDQLVRAIPWLSYDRIEFAANIVLFVPFGVLLALILVRGYLVLPIAIVTTVAIESAQAVLLEERTPSITDVIANVTGACIGLLLVGIVEWLGREPGRSDDADRAVVR